MICLWMENLVFVFVLFYNYKYGMIRGLKYYRIWMD